MIEFISIAAAGFAAYSLYLAYRNVDRQLHAVFFFALALKLVAGISLGLVYRYYYFVGDTFGFYEDARGLVALAVSNFDRYQDFMLSSDTSFADVLGLINGESRSIFFVKLLSVFLLFSFNNYWIASLYFSCVSFLTAWYIVRVIDKTFPNGVYAAIVSFLFIPSVLFWGSGIVKETVALSSLFVIAGVFIKAYRNLKLSLAEWLSLVLATYFLWNLKYYWAALFFPSALAVWLAHGIVNSQSLKWKRFEVLLWLGIFLLLVLIATSFHPNFYLSRLLTVIVQNNEAYHQAGGPAINFYQLAPTWGSVLLNSPWALISGLYRPFIFEVTTVFQAGIAMENLLLTVLTFVAFKKIPELWKSPSRLLIIGLVAYIVLLTIFLSLSTPNFGTLSRYRVGLLPFLFFLLLYDPAHQVISRWFKLK